MASAAAATTTTTTTTQIYHIVQNSQHIIVNKHQKNFKFKLPRVKDSAKVYACVFSNVCAIAVAAYRHTSTISNYPSIVSAQSISCEYMSQLVVCLCMPTTIVLIFAAAAAAFVGWIDVLAHCVYAVRDDTVCAATAAA